MSNSSRNKELAKNTIILGFGQIVPKFLAMIVLPILTTYLSTDAYGTYDLITSIAGLLIPLMTVQIQQAVFRFLLAKNADFSREEYISTAVTFIVLSSLIMIPIVFAVLSIGFQVTAYYSVLVCALYIAEAFYQLFGQTVRGLGSNIKFSVGVILFAVSNMFSTIVFVAVLKMGLNGVILSLTIGYLCADIYMLVSSRMIRLIHTRNINMVTFKRLISFSAPIVPSSIALWVVNLSDRLIVIHFLGTGANGIYAVANKIPTLYNTAYHVFNLAWTETASRVKDEGEPTEYYSNLFRGLYNFLIGMMLLLVPLTPLLFLIFVKGEYSVAFYQVPILYFGVFFNSFVNFYSGIYIALKRTTRVGISSAVGAVLNIIINLTMINTFGLYAASVSTALSFMIIAVYRAYDLNKVIKIKYHFSEILLGFFLFVLSSVLIYFNNAIVLAIGFGIALVYNYRFNKILVIKLLSKVPKKKRK